MTHKELQIEQLRASYYSAIAIANTYYKRASMPHYAHNYEHNISKAAEFDIKSEGLGRLISKLRNA